MFSHGKESIVALPKMDQWGQSREYHFIHNKLTTESIELSYLLWEHSYIIHPLQEISDGV